MRVRDIQFLTIGLVLGYIVTSYCTLSQSPPCPVANTLLSLPLSTIPGGSVACLPCGVCPPPTPCPPQAIPAPNAVADNSLSTPPPLPSAGKEQREKCFRELKQNYKLNIKDVHSIPPFDNFVPSIYGVAGPDVTGWGLDTNVFDAVINWVKPKFHVEVGSWKGSSIIYYANKMRAMHPHGECLMAISVDTWLGTTHAWHNEVSKMRTSCELLSA